MIKNDENNEDLNLRQYYRAKLKLKQMTIRYHLKCGLKTIGVKDGELNKSKLVWNKLNEPESKKLTSDLFTERMRGL